VVHDGLPSGGVCPSCGFVLRIGDEGFGRTAAAVLAWNTQDHCLSKLLPWSAPFEDPIVLSDGRKLLTLKDAADYITTLPKKESALPEWQTAIEALMLCSRGGQTMMARIGVMKALNRGQVRDFEDTGKKQHWGGRSSRGTNDRLFSDSSVLPQMSRMAHPNG
jgi:hypothetical protein